MAKIQLEEICIASIYPGKTEVIRLAHGSGLNAKGGRLTAYALEAVPREKTENSKYWSKKPFVLTVTDAYESVPAPWKSNGPQLIYDTMPVDVNQIADHLISQWAGNLMGMPAGVTPGIMKIRGSIAHNDEVQELIEKQTAYAEHMFEQAERLVFDRQVKFITQPMRDSAIWLGRARNWVNSRISDNKVPCRWCKALVDEDAYVCQTCSRVLRKAPEDWAEDALELATRPDVKVTQPVVAG